MTKQECAIKYITENYLDYRRLRHDIVADKLQIRMADSLSAPHNATSVSGIPQSWTAKRKGNGNTRCTRVTGRELAGKSASTKQPMAMENIKKWHF